jgi:hypothetical protein
MSNYRDDKDKLKQARHDAAQLTIFHNWIQENPQWDYTAAHEMIKNYYDGESWTAENLTASAERLAAKGAIKPLRAKTEADIIEEEAEERQDLVNFILANRNYSKESKDSERRRFMKTFANGAPVVDITTLRTFKNNILEKRRLTAMTTEEQKTEARENIARAQAAQGMRQGRWQPVPLIMRHKEMLKAASAEELRSLAARCGWDQLNAILQAPDSDGE